MPCFTAVALIVLALLTAAALFPPKKQKSGARTRTRPKFSVSWPKQKATKYSTLFPKKQRTATQ
jgi:hypothetical protein